MSTLQGLFGVELHHGSPGFIVGRVTGGRRRTHLLTSATFYPHHDTNVEDLASCVGLLCMIWSATNMFRYHLLLQCYSYPRRCYIQIPRGDRIQTLFSF